jgi:hypothetical protein
MDRESYRVFSDVIVYIKDNGFITELLPYNFAIYAFNANYFVDWIPPPN